jgi:hypothetical protein
LAVDVRDQVTAGDLLDDLRTGRRSRLANDPWRPPFFRGAVFAGPLFP